MIKPRGPKAKQRKPKVEAARVPSKRPKKSDGARTLSIVAKVPQGASAAYSGEGVSQTNEPEAVPLALAGRWIAWSSDGLRIIGSAVTLNDAEEVASRAGEQEPIFQRVVGMTRR
jgi:hypothetical protein